MENLNAKTDFYKAAINIIFKAILSKALVMFVLIPISTTTNFITHIFQYLILGDNQ